MKTRDVLKFILTSKYSAWALMLLLIQQLVVASSTYWLAKFASVASSGQSILIYGSLYGASLIIPFLPGILSMACVNLWELDLLKKFMDRFIAKNKGQIALWRSNSERSTRTSLLSKEGPQALQESANYFYDLVSTGLNVLLNTVVVSLVIHPIFAISYGLSLLLCATLIWKTSGKNESLAIAAQDSSIRFTSVMLRIWDNVLLANPFNFDAWKTNADKSFTGARCNRLKSVGFGQAMSGLTTIVMMLPTMGAVIWFLNTHQSNSSETASLLITLPRLFMILNFTFHILSLCLGWVAHISRVRAVFEGIEANGAKTDDLNSQINFSLIRVEGAHGTVKLKNLSDFKDVLNGPGRFTIRGQNGAGKTALLLSLKRELSSKATYVPSIHDLDIGENRPDQSTGQRARTVLSEIFVNDQSPVILLDEWDANLDADNRQVLSNKIAAEAQDRCIVEVVHSRLH